MRQLAATCARDFDRGQCPAGEPDGQRQPRVSCIRIFAPTVLAGIAAELSLELPGAPSGRFDAAVLSEISDDWETERAYLSMEAR
jgi:hypothetical protein